MENSFVVITTEQKIPVNLDPRTEGGAHAQLDGAPVWEKDGDFTIEPSEDGLACMIVSGDTKLNGTVTVTADVDLGEGIQSMSSTIDVIIVEPSANALGMIFGKAVLKA